MGNDILSSLRPDPATFLRAAMEWHFDPRTGSPFWLDRAPSLGFDPRADVVTFDDLDRFPDLTPDLRLCPAEELVPRGLDGIATVGGIFESGGTTGAPKRIAFVEDWIRQNLAWSHRNLDRNGVPRGVNWLSTAPGPPHGVGFMTRRQVAERAGLCFTIDVDPRWVKKLIAAGDTAMSEVYLDHLVEQVRIVLASQDVRVMMTTPPMLARIEKDDELVGLVRRRIAAIVWVGTQMPPEDRRRYRTETFPGIVLHGTYGNTMILGANNERAGLTPDDPCIFDSNSPFVTLRVVDPATREAVPYGTRGRVVMNHVSKGAFVPNNLERDTAVRIEPPPGQLGDSVADVRPVDVFEGEPVIEGIY